LFQRGAFDEIATGMTATALLFYSLGLFAYAGNVMLLRVYFSMQDTLTPVKIGMVTLVFKIVLSLILVRHLAHGGLALATSITASVTFSLLAYYLRKKLRRIDGQRIVRSFAKIIFASFVMGIVSWIGLNLSEPSFHNLASLTQQFLQLSWVILIGVLTYFGTAVLLRIEELAKIRRLKYYIIKR